MTIEQRAEAYAWKTYFEPPIDRMDIKQSYIAGAAEERALMEAGFNSVEDLITDFNRADRYAKNLKVVPYASVKEYMQAYASHQTASLEARIKELESENAALKQLFNTTTDKAVEMINSNTASLNRVKELEQAVKDMYDCKDKRTRHSIMFAALNNPLDYLEPKI